MPAVLVCIRASWLGLLLSQTGCGSWSGCRGGTEGSSAQTHLFLGLLFAYYFQSFFIGLGIFITVLDSIFSLFGKTEMQGVG